MPKTKASTAKDKSDTSHSVDLQLIPMPREIKYSGGHTKLSSRWVICVDPELDENYHPIRQLTLDVYMLFQWEWLLESTENAKKPGKEQIIIRDCPMDINEPDLFNEQGYRLMITTDSIIVEAPSAVGRFYGVQTLRQIFRNHKNRTIPCLEIKDYPQMRYRGVSDDISRGQVSLGFNFMQVIDELAYYKINLFQPYMEDMFQFETDPDIGRARGAVTKEEFSQMVLLAKENYIELCPVFECLGHQDRLLSLPQNRKYAERDDTSIDPWSFSPAKPEAVAFVKILIDELVDATPGNQFFHVGCDESYDIGEGPTRKAVEEWGEGPVFAEYINQLNEYITKKHNRRMMFYGDMIIHYPQAMDILSKDAIVVDWQYWVGKDYPSVKKIRDAGFKNVIVSPGTWGWARFYNDYTKGFENIRVITEVGKREGAIGLIVSSWGDFGAENLRENNLLGYIYGAAVSWEEIEEQDVASFLRRYIRTFYGLDPDSQTGNALLILEKSLGFLPNPLNELMTVLFHAAPKIQKQDDSLMCQLEEILEIMEEGEDVLFNQKTQIPFKAQHVLSLCHIHDCYQYVSNKMYILDVATEEYEKRRNDPYFYQELAGDLIGLQDDFQATIHTFTKCWLRTNKYPNIEYNLQRFKNQLEDLQELIRLSQLADIKPYTVPTAKWIAYPEPKESPLRERSGHRYYIKEINLSKPVASAELIGWADDGAEFFINGEPQFKVIMEERQKIKSVKAFLKPGRNLIAADVVTHLPSICTVIAELRLTYTDGTRESIVTDETWRVTKQSIENWQATYPSAFDTHWVSASVPTHPWIKIWDALINWPPIKE